MSWPKVKMLTIIGKDFLIPFVRSFYVYLVKSYGWKQTSYFGELAKFLFRKFQSESDLMPARASHFLITFQFHPLVVSL